MNAKDFNGPSLRFVPEGDPVSRYTMAKKEWDDRIGNSRVQAYNWRLVALGELGIIFVLAVGLIFQSAKSTIVPYVVEMDSGTGIVRNVTSAKEVNYNPKEEEIKSFIAQFIMKTRSVPLDPIVYRNNWISAYSCMQQNAAKKMDGIAKSDNQLSMLGHQTVQPNIISIVPIGKNSFQVRWNEDIYNLDGGKKETIRLTGVFTIAFGKPKNEKELLANPLGIFVTDFSFTEDYSGGDKS